jgi:hypothetical protein
MVFELIPFIACTSAVGALGTGAWYVAMKEYKLSEAQEIHESPSHEELIRSTELQKNRLTRPSSSSTVSNLFGVGIDFFRMPSGIFVVSSLLSGCYVIIS